jgi:protein TonB
MLLPNNDITSLRPSGATSNRLIAMGSVGLLHVLAIYALVTGMASHIVKKYVPPDLQIAWIDAVTPPRPVPLPPHPRLTQPQSVHVPSVPIPVFRGPDSDGGGINVMASQSHVEPVGDSGASGLSNTHTTPPYPAESRALSHQGTVLLQITVSPQGDVVAANIVRSSGYAELDRVALSWVVAHWKYRPALVGGVTVTSATQAAVKFDLKEVRH